jgi:DNA-binding NarL/FixJ family response regulator
MPSAKLLLIDSNNTFLREIAQLLQPQFEVIATFQNGAAALQQVMALSPDVILLEVSLGDYNGFEIARRIRLLGSKAKVVFLSLHAYPEFVHAAQSIGASGYIFKSRTGSDLVRGIEAVAAGQAFFSED